MRNINKKHNINKGLIISLVAHGFIIFGLFLFFKNKTETSPNPKISVDVVTQNNMGQTQKNNNVIAPNLPSQPNNNLQNNNVDTNKIETEKSETPQEQLPNFNIPKENNNLAFPKFDNKELSKLPNFNINSAIKPQYDNKQKDKEAQTTNNKTLNNRNIETKTEAATSHNKHITNNVASSQRPKAPAAKNEGNLAYNYDIPAGTNSASGQEGDIRIKPNISGQDLSLMGSNISSDLAQLIKAHIKEGQCWDEPDNKGLKVKLSIKLAPNGSINDINLISPASKIGQSREMKSAMDSAVNAVKKCAPYDFLPSNRYSEWKNFIFSFEPK